jgi:hypothetical protein
MWWLDGGNIDQDQQLDFISKGVTNLKNYSTTMKNETELHVRLLDDIDTDVSRATDGLETEGARAAQVMILILICLAKVLTGCGRDVGETAATSNSTSSSSSSL